jgi:hypothetical protein
MPQVNWQCLILDGNGTAAAVLAHKTWSGSASLTYGRRDWLRRHPSARLTESGPWRSFSRRCPIQAAGAA